MTELIAEESTKFIEAQIKENPFFIYIPFTAPHSPYQGPNDYRPEVLPKESYLWNQSKGPKAIYYAMIESMDQAVNKILHKVEDKEMTENTLVIFMSDNGASLSGNNGHLRSFKGRLFEGGIRVPCVVKWPGKIPAGLVSDQPCISMDFTASIIRAAGTNPPQKRPFDGIDILKLIEENQPIQQRSLFWRARRGNITRKAVRYGDLKYICQTINGKLEEFLFNIKLDIEERNNLLSSSSEQIQQLKKLLDLWEEKVEPVR